MSRPALHLPIDDQLANIAKQLDARGALVLVAEPGTGKTTRVPAMLAEQGHGAVLVVEPRRVAARMAARRVASERGWALGGEVGWQVRFENRASRDTRLVFMTDGVLLRRLQRDPELIGVSTVVLDEFHERSLEVDLALAWIAEVRSALRPELRVLVMSATLDPQPIADFLGAQVLRVVGQVFPLESRHVDLPPGQLLPQSVLQGVRLALEEPGDVLVFLPGKGEIERSQESLSGLARERDLELLTLHGEQAPEQQDRVFAPCSRRKVILSTNIAESSLTVPGVRCVVDSGLARVLTHDPGLGMERLEQRRISKASAAQRAGRAAREAPGRVLRLWSRADETKMLERDLPELLRADLAPALLELAQWGVADPAVFRWFEAPDAGALSSARKLLVRLEALEPGRFAISATGRALAAIPAHPRLARLLLEGHRRGLLPECAELAALLSERDLLPARAARERLPKGPSDLLARRDLWLHEGRSLPAQRVRALEHTADQLERSASQALRAWPQAERPTDAPERESQLLRCVLAGYPDRVARRREAGSAEALVLGGRALQLDASSCLAEEHELFCALEVDLGARGKHAALVRQASAIERAWLAELPGGLREESVCLFDEQREAVIVSKRLCYEDLHLTSSESGRPDPAVARPLLFAAAMRQPLRALDDSTEGRGLLARARALCQWMPELAWPDLEPAALIAVLETWSTDACSLAQLRKIELRTLLRAHLGERLFAALEQHAPESLELPSGTHKRLEYAEGKPPVLAVRLQELFGLARGPRVAAGRVPVLLHLLAPNQRVVQVTQDLESFWNTTYEQVRKELRARYPRHSWPEDPWNAVPTARPKRRGS